MTRSTIITSKEMIELIRDVEQNQHGTAQFYPSKIKWMQCMHHYDDITIGVRYDEAFETFISNLEIALSGSRIYRPTAKKILNSWYCWAYEQHQPLINAPNKSKEGDSEEEPNFN